MRKRLRSTTDTVAIRLALVHHQFGSQDLSKLGDIAGSEFKVIPVDNHAEVSSAIIDEYAGLTPCAGLALLGSSTIAIDKLTRVAEFLENRLLKLSPRFTR